MFFTKIKKYLHIGIILISSLVFFGELLYLLFSNEDEKTYSTSVSVVNLYIMSLLVICCLDALQIKATNLFISANFKVLMNPIGKSTFFMLTALIYIGSDNVSQMLIGIMMLVCGILLIAMEKMCTVEDKEEAPLQNVCNVSNVEEVKEKEEKDKNNPYNVPEDF